MAYVEIVTTLTPHFLDRVQITLRTTVDDLSNGCEAIFVGRVHGIRKTCDIVDDRTSIPREWSSTCGRNRRDKVGRPEDKEGEIDRSRKLEHIFRECIGREKLLILGCSSDQQRKGLRGLLGWGKKAMIRVYKYMLEGSIRWNRAITVGG